VKETTVLQNAADTYNTAVTYYNSMADVMMSQVRSSNCGYYDSTCRHTRRIWLGQYQHLKISAEVAQDRAAEKEAAANANRSARPECFSD
jgi:hypothetical protein